MDSTRLDKSRGRAFTLLEVVVALGVLLALASLALPALLARLPAARLAEAVGSLESAVAQAQARAMREGRLVRVEARRIEPDHWGLRVVALEREPAARSGSEPALAGESLEMAQPDASSAPPASDVSIEDEPMFIDVRLPRGVRLGESLGAVVGEAMLEGPRSGLGAGRAAQRPTGETAQLLALELGAPMRADQDGPMEASEAASITIAVLTPGGMVVGFGSVYVALGDRIREIQIDGWTGQTRVTVLDDLLQGEGAEAADREVGTPEDRAPAMQERSGESAGPPARAQATDGGSAGGPR